MRQLVYFSRAKPFLSDETLDALLEVSRRRNAEVGLTGLLLFDRQRFLQALEGDADAVRATMRRIVQDDRHDTVQIASETTVHGRQFTRWAMDIRCAHKVSCAVEFLDAVKADVARVRSASLKALFIGFARMGCNLRSPPSEITTPSVLVPRMPLPNAR